MPESFPQFVRIDRERKGHAHHFVVHTGNPSFTLELLPDREAPDQAGKGVLKRLCVPNSWAGDYGKYSSYVAVAQDFFARSHPPENRWKRMGDGSG